MIILSEKDEGRTVEVSAGSIITVRLIENPTTGYRWKVESSGTMELVGDSFEGTGGAIGAAGARVFRFRAVRPGSNTLRIKNWREWEGESSIIGRFNATVLVK